MRSAQSKGWLPRVGHHRVHLFFPGWTAVTAGWTENQPVHKLRLPMGCVAGDMNAYRPTGIDSARPVVCVAGSTIGVAAPKMRATAPGLPGRYSARWFST